MGTHGINNFDTASMQSPALSKKTAQHMEMPDLSTDEASEILKAAMIGTPCRRIWRTMNEDGEERETWRSSRAEKENTILSNILEKHRYVRVRGPSLKTPRHARSKILKSAIKLIKASTDESIGLLS